jgi:hypothetical protein
MMLAVARILQRFDLLLPREPSPALSAGFALGLAHGLPVRFVRRVRMAARRDPGVVD